MVKVKKEKMNFWKRLLHNFDYYFVLFFLLVRLIINVEMKPLMIFFFIVYLVLTIMLLKKTRWFSEVAILFLAIDSMIGTYLFTMAQNMSFEYYGTMFVNLISVYFIVRNKSKRFRN